MAQTYEVKLVSDKEWDRLVASTPRYEHATDSMGFADPVAKRAYVRSTRWADLNRYLIGHEFDHLLEEQGTDEDEHGIRHKKGFLRNYASVMAAPFTAGASLGLGTPQQQPVVGSVGGPLNQAANAIYQTAPQAIGAGFGNMVAGPPGAAVGAGLGRALGAMATGQRAVGKEAAVAGAAGGAGAFGGQLGQAAGGAAGQALGQTAGGALGGGTASAAFGQGFRPGMQAGATQEGLLSAGQGAMKLFTPGVGPSVTTGNAPFGQVAPQASTPTGGVPTGGTSTGSSLGSGLNSSPQSPLQRLTSGAAGGGGGGGFYRPLNAQGVGLTQGFGTPTMSAPTQTAANPSMKMFGMPKSVWAPLVGGAAISALGQGAVKNPAVPNLSQTPSVQDLVNQSNTDYKALIDRMSTLSSQPLPSALASPIERQYGQMGRQLYSQYAASQPGVDLRTTSGPGSYSVAEQDLAQRKAEAMAQAQLNWQGNERQNITAQAGLTQEQLSNLSSIAQLDLQTIMSRFNLDYATAQQFKQIFGNLGGALGQVGIMNAYGQP